MSWSLCGSKVQSPMKTAVSNYRCETILTLVQFSSNSSGRSSNGGDGCDDYGYGELWWSWWWLCVMEMVVVVVMVMLVTGDCVDGGGGELWWRWGW